MTDQSTNRFSPGNEISRYTILEKIGSGGFGEVYKAKANNDVTVNDRTIVKQGGFVAIKVFNRSNFNSEDAREDARKRFHREIKILRSFDDKQPIIKIIDYGEHNDEPYYVMEFIAGGSLAEKLKKGCIDRETAISITEIIAKALAYAHTFKYEDEFGYINGIIHRDVKPHNILLDEKGVPLLADFGIARVLDAKYHATVTDSFFGGTPEYMAPEQFRLGGKLSPATDLYALAIVFFEMMTGQRPKDETGGYLSHESGNSEIGLYFHEFFKKATGQDPAKRYQSAKAFLDALMEANKRTEDEEKDLQIKRNKAREIIKKVLRDIEIELDLNDEDEILYKLVHLNITNLSDKQKDYLLESVETARNYDHEYVIAELLEYILRGEIVQYVKKLAQVAEESWVNNQLKAVEFYHRIYYVIEGNPPDREQIESIWQNVRNRLIEYHFDRGKAVSGEISDEAINILEQSCSWLDKLGADTEKNDLLGDLEDLRIKKLSQEIDELNKHLEKLNVELKAENSDPVKEDEVIENYNALIRVYRQLLEIQERHEWKKALNNDIRSKLKQQYHKFAQGAKEKKQYPRSHKLYQELIKILSEENRGVPADIDKEFEDIEKLIGYEEDYQKIIHCFKMKKYGEVLTRVGKSPHFEDFLQYNDVAKYLWGSIYALRHNELPPGWDRPVQAKEERQGLIVRLKDGEPERIQSKEQPDSELKQEVAKATGLDQELEANKQRANEAVALREKDLLIVSIIAFFGALALFVTVLLSSGSALIVTAVIFLVLIFVTLWRYLRS